MMEESDLISGAERLGKVRGEITQARLSLSRSYLHQDMKVESLITDESLLGKENSMYKSLLQEQGRFKELRERQCD